MEEYRRLRERGHMSRFSLIDLLKTIGILIGVSLVGVVFHQIGFKDSNIIMVYILGVLLTAIVTTGRIYSILMSLVSVLVFNFLFTVPKYTFHAYDPDYPVTFLIMFLAAFLTSSLTVQIKRQAAHSAEMAYRTQVLLETNQLLQQESEDKILEVTARQLTKLLRREVVFYPVSSGKQEAYRADDGYLYLNVRSADVIYAVVGVPVEKEPLTSFENSLLLSILGECGLALEKDMLARKREEAAAEAKNEKLRANLLRSISHDLRTPLTSISGNAGVLLSSGERLEEGKKKQLYTDIYEDSMWLINLVENLLSVTRIEDGTMHLNLSAELLEEVVEEARRHVGRHGENHNIQIVQKDELILVKIDTRLIIQVIINLVDNAIKYTPPGSDIIVTIGKDGSDAVLEVADSGPGIPEEAKKKIFEMFYTVNNGIADSRRSLGLGLALCKSIVAAHGGTITVRDNVPCGTVFRFTLPLEEAHIHE